MAPVSAFVRMSARCSLVGKYSTEIVFDLVNSRMKWKRTSMCLVLAELRGLFASEIAPPLSTNTLMQFSEIDGMMKERTPFTNKAYLTPSPGATYSASVVERVRIFCVLQNQLIDDLPIVTATPDTDLRSSAFSV